MKKALADQRQQPFDPRRSPKVCARRSVTPPPSPPAMRRASVWTRSDAPPNAPAAVPYIASRFSDEEPAVLRQLVFGDPSAPADLTGVIVPTQPHPDFVEDARFLRGVVSVTPNVCERAPELLRALTYLFSLSADRYSALPPATAGNLCTIIVALGVSNSGAEWTEQLRGAADRLIDLVGEMRRRDATDGGESGAPASKRPRR